MKKIILLSSLFIFHFSLFGQQWLWSRNGIGDAAVWSTKSDGYGNCYIIGQFPNDTIHFGAYTFMNSTLTNPPYSNYADPFIVKYSPTGTLLWAKQWICLDTSKSHATFSPATGATGINGCVYLNADYTDTVKIGTYTEVNLYGYGQGSTCLTKYDSNGNIKWVRTSRNSHADTTIVVGQYTSCDRFGNVFLSGISAYDTVYFGSQQLYFNHSDLWHSFLVKYDSAGNVKWARQSKGLTVNSNDVNFGIANDNYGNTFLTGVFVDTMQFGAFTLRNNNQSDIELIKYDSAGNVLWAKQSITPGSSPFTSAGATCVTTDKVGNAYICGNLDDTIILGTDSAKATKNGFSTFFVAKYSPNGNVLWVKSASVLDLNSWSTTSIASDNHNHIYLSANGGHGICKIAFGGDTLSMDDTAKHDGASVVFKLDSNGKALCGAITPVGTEGGLYNSIGSDTSGKYVYLGSQAATVGVFGKDTINPYSYPLNRTQGLNYFPFVARWEACDSSILLPVQEEQRLVIDGKVLVYPNPSNGVFNILIEQATHAKVKVYDIFGQDVYSGNINSKNTQINLEDKAVGIYFYRITNETGSLLGEGKVITQH